MGRKLKFRREIIADDGILVASRRTARIETGAQAAEAARLTSGEWIWTTFEGLLKKCNAVLKAEGFPTLGRAVRHLGDGKWKPMPKPIDLKRFRGEIVWANWLVERYAEKLSDAWFAARVGKMCREALSYRDKLDGDGTHCVALSFQIGRECTLWRFHRANKPSILTGRAVKKGGEIGGAMRRNSLSGDTVERIEEMRRLIAEGHTQRGAADALARRGIGKSLGANLKLWQRHGRKT